MTYKTADLSPAEVAVALFEHQPDQHRPPANLSDTWRRWVVGHQVSEQHYETAGVCACGRPLPCVHAAVVEPYATSYQTTVAALAALKGPTTVVEMVKRGINPTADSSPQEAVAAEPGRRWWRRFGRGQS